MDRILQKLQLTLLLIFITVICFGQTFTISGMLVDKEDETELPYVNVYVLGHTIGTSSNSKGVFEIELKESFKLDSLVFSAIGYQPKKIAISDFKNGILKLEKQLVEIKDITISSSSKRNKRLVLNKFNKHNSFVQYSPVEGCWYPSRPKEPTIEALFFPFKQEYSRNNYLTEAWFYTSNYKATPSYFLIRLMKPDQEGKPGRDLLTMPVKVEVIKSHSLVKVDLAKYKLSFPEDGLFIGVELLIIEDNKYQVRNEGGETISLYSPFLNYNHSKTKSSYWLYSKGMWKKQQKKVIGGPILSKNMKPNRFIKPSISLVIKK